MVGGLCWNAPQAAWIWRQKLVNSIHHHRFRHQSLHRSFIPSSKSFPPETAGVLRTAIMDSKLFTVHYLRWRMPPFMRQCWGLPHRLPQCTRPQGWGKLVNALITEACVNLCCATSLLSSELVGPACVQARSSNPRGRACSPSGKGSGPGGRDIEWRCTCIFILPGF